MKNNFFPVLNAFIIAKKNKIFKKIAMLSVEITESYKAVGENNNNTEAINAAVLLTISFTVIYNRITEIIPRKSCTQIIRFRLVENIESIFIRSG